MERVVSYKFVNGTGTISKKVDKKIVKSTFIKWFSARFDGDGSIARECASLIIGYVRDVKLNGRRIEIRGFGSFSCKTRTQRNARNPKTGQKIIATTKNYVVFKASALAQLRANELVRQLVE
ncbi:hypothetical protein C1N51_27340 (plasmid) [Vibrio campbellii]|nr:hypothetical protein C1N51_27340 [Vibrio campbellii]